VVCSTEKLLHLRIDCDVLMGVCILCSLLQFGPESFVFSFTFQKYQD
jgi:hypothetical protein